MEKILIRCILFICSFAILLGCYKAEVPGIESKAVHIIGSNHKQTLFGIWPTPDGGYLAATRSFKNGFDNILLSKFNIKNEFNWDTEIGSSTSYEYGPNLLIDTVGEIYLACITEGKNQDTIPLTQSKSYGMLLARLNSFGVPQWESVQYFSRQNSQGNTQQIPFITESVDDNILVCANLVYGASFVYDLSGVLMVFGKGGNLNKSFITGEDVQVMNVVDSMGKYYCAVQRKNTVGYYEFDGTDTGFHNSSIAQRAVLRPENIRSTNRVLTRKSELSTQYFTSDLSAFQLRYIPETKMIESSEIPSPFETIDFYSINSKGGYLIVADGVLYETDHEFNLKKELILHDLTLVVDEITDPQICKLNDGGYVVGYQRGQEVFLFRLDKDGYLNNDE